MKIKHTVLLAAFFTASVAGAQEISDAMRYAQDNLTGTARFRAMGGAFGALGGDFSALNVNPAGSAIFANNQVGLSLSFLGTDNRSNYFGTRRTENNFAFDINQAGGVFVYNNEDAESDWKKVTLALNYENMNNFENTMFTAGTNPLHSIDSYFLSYANGADVTLSTLENAYYEELGFGAAQAFLGFQGYVINPVADEPGNTLYETNVPAGGDYYHENSMVSTGFNGKLTFTVAAKYQDRLFVGLNLNSHFTDYRVSTSFYERNENTPDAQLQRLRFNNDLYTAGHGFSFNLGTIFKVTEEFRAGLAYESPTWYRLTDELSQSLSSITAEQPETVIVDPAITVVYAPYKLQTPGKWTGSMAYVFGSKGLISVDYSMKDYSNTRFRPENDFSGTNAAMSNLLEASSEIRVGAEYRLKQWSLRGGYRYEQSPYKNGETIGDLNSISAGIGYSFENNRIDLAYSHARRDSQQAFFSQGLVDPAMINTVQNNVTISAVFGF